MSVIAELAVGAAGKVIDRIFPDPAQKAAAQLELLRLAQTGELAQLTADTELAQAQIALNSVEAQSDSLFKSGWRPAAGWVCVFALAYQMIFRPLFGWLATSLFGWAEPPSLEVDTLLTLLFGMLGLGAYRTFEKVKRA